MSARPWPPTTTSRLFELGAHNFLTLTLFIALFERDYAEPLGFQREYAAQARALEPCPTPISLPDAVTPGSVFTTPLAFHAAARRCYFSVHVFARHR